MQKSAGEQSPPFTVQCQWAEISAPGKQRRSGDRQQASTGCSHSSKQADIQRDQQWSHPDDRSPFYQAVVILLKNINLTPRLRRRHTQKFSQSLNFPDAGKIFTRAPDADIRKLLADEFLPTDAVRMEQNILILNTGDSLVLRTNSPAATGTWYAFITMEWMEAVNF